MALPWFSFAFSVKNYLLQFSPPLSFSSHLFAFFWVALVWYCSPASPWVWALPLQASPANPLKCSRWASSQTSLAWCEQSDSWSGTQIQLGPRWRSMGAVLISILTRVQLFDDKCWTISKVILWYVIGPGPDSSAILFPPNDFQPLGLACRCHRISIDLSTDPISHIPPSSSARSKCSDNLNQRWPLAVAGKARPPLNLVVLPGAWEQETLMTATGTAVLI